MRVAIVDDNDDSADSIVEMVEKLGFRARTFRRWTELVASGAAFDVVLSDVIAACPFHEEDRFGRYVGSYLNEHPTTRLAIVSAVPDARPIVESLKEESPGTEVVVLTWSFGFGELSELLGVATEE